MDSNVHEMVCLSREDDEALFACIEPGCGRQLALDLRRGRRRLIAPGDELALHSGAVGMAFTSRGIGEGDGHG